MYTMFNTDVMCLSCLLYYFAWKEVNICYTICCLPPNTSHWKLIFILVYQYLDLRLIWRYHSYRVFKHTFLQYRVECFGNFQIDWVEWLFNVTFNDISVTYSTAHRCAGGLKKLDLRSGSQRHRHFVGFFNVPVQALTQGHPFYSYS